MNIIDQINGDAALVLQDYEEPLKRLDPLGDQVFDGVIFTGFASDDENINGGSRNQRVAQIIVSKAKLVLKKKMRILDNDGTVWEVGPVTFKYDLCYADMKGGEQTHAGKL